MTDVATSEEVIDFLARTLFKQEKFPMDSVASLATMWSRLHPLQRQIYRTRASEVVWLVDSLRSGATPYPFTDQERDPST